MFGLEAAGAGFQLDRGEDGAVVDVQRRFDEDRGGVLKGLPVAARERAVDQFLKVHARFGAQQAQGQLLGPHFQAEDEHGQLRFDGDVARDVHGQGGLSHRGTGGDDVQRAALQAAGEPVDADEAAGDAGDAGVLAVEGFFDLVEGGGHDVAQTFEVGLVALARHFEDEALGVLQQFAQVLALVVAHAHDGVAGADQAAVDGLVAHDAGVIGGVGRRGHAVDDGGEERLPPQLLEQAAVLQLGAEREHVHGAAALDHVHDHVEDVAVVQVVKIVGRQKLGDVDQRFAVEQAGAEDRPFGVEIARRQAVEDLVRHGLTAVLPRTASSRTRRRRRASASADKLPAP